MSRLLSREITISEIKGLTSIYSCVAGVLCISLCISVYRSMMTKKESCILSLQEALGESHARIREMDQAYANMMDE